MTAATLKLLPDVTKKKRNHNHGHKLGIENLSPKELQVAVMMATGLTNKEIASRFNNSHKTISTYRERIFWKLSMKDTVTLAHLLLARGKMQNIYANEPNG